MTQPIDGSELNSLRQQAQVALQESERRFHALVRDLPNIAVQGYDQNRRVIFWNAASEVLYGYKRGEVMDQLLEELVIPPEMRDAVIGAITNWVTNGVPIPAGELTLQKKDGSPIHVFSSHAMLVNSHGDQELFCVDIDLTASKQVEASLRESEMRYRILFDRANDGIMLLTADGKLTAVNESFARMHGYTATEMQVMNLRDFDSPETAKHIPERMRRLLAGEALTFEVEHYHKDGHLFLLEVSASLVTLGGQAVIQCVHRDITERKRAEAEKAKLEAQFHQAQKMESVGRLAGGVAHDFNNMLQAILGNANLALDEIPPDSPIRESLEEIRSCARRSADLTRQLLAFARQQPIAPRVLDLNETVESLLKMLRRLISEDIQLAWLPATDLALINVDPTQIDQVLANLCVNARDAIDGVGKVTIETGNAVMDDAYCADHPGVMPGAYVRLAVSDDGCGMDKATMSKIFEPFFTTKGLGKGTGLGLATVYGIVKQNHGFISVSSEPGKGTIFNLYLPQYVGEPAAPQKESVAERPKSSGETVLLVEDEPAILAIARRILERLGYTVVAANSPSEAIRLADLHAGEIHLLMTDVVMPEMNGRDLAQRLMARHPQLRCLFMSGYTRDVIAHHGVLAEGMNFIEKPFTIDGVANKVRAALARNA
ncbi:MAG: PAS domain S-box protein [Verrucomicrobiota bacterium]